MRNTICIPAVVLVALIAGCYTIGSPFTRPPFETFRLGSTSERDVLAGVGAPGIVTRFEKNGSAIACHRFLDYGAMGYATGQGALTKGNVGREMTICFAGGVIVGYVYSSNKSADSTNFDALKAPRIQRGRTTRAEVVALFGPPSGMAVFPLATNRGGTELRYSYTGMEGAMVTGSLVSKDATIQLDANDIVTEVEVTAGRPQ